MKHWIFNFEFKKMLTDNARQENVPPIDLNRILKSFLKKNDKNSLKNRSKINHVR